MKRKRKRRNKKGKEKKRSKRKGKETQAAEVNQSLLLNRSFISMSSVRQHLGSPPDDSQVCPQPLKANQARTHPHTAPQPHSRTRAPPQLGSAPRGRSPGSER